MTSNRTFCSSERGGLISWGQVLLSLLIVSGVGVGYAAYTAHEEQVEGVNIEDDFEQDIGAVSDKLSQTLSYINHHDTKNLDEVETAFESDIEAYNTRQGYSYEYIEINNIEVEDDGVRITQTDPSQNLSVWTGSDYEEDWTALSGADDTRQFVLDLNTDTLPESDGNYPRFEIEGETYGVYRDANTVVIFDEDANDILCSRLFSGGSPPETVSVDLLNGEIEGEPCDGYEIHSEVENINFENTGDVEGVFSITYRGDASDRGGNVEFDSNPPDRDEVESATAHDVVYAAVADVTVSTSERTITRPIIIAPGSIQEDITNWDVNEP